jgi:hypothetical protein
MEATLSSDVSKVMPLPCIDKLKYMRLFKISMRYASYCNQEKSEKSLVSNVPFKDRKKSSFFTQLKHPLTRVTSRHTINFNMKNYSFRKPILLQGNLDI